jgi:5-hydroxyisourate hydrolase-like protein (transthyretin family)
VGAGSFILGSNKVRPSVTGEFLRSRDKELKLWFQAYNLKLDEATKKPSATIEMLFTKNNQEVKKIVEQSSEFSNAAAQMTFVKSLPLSDFEPGQYSIQVKVTDNLTKDLIVAKDTFVVR